ncbi:HAD-IC family P-type ATPase [Micromonospora sp. WMMD1082]|uniref:cation-translocating P-type ATPase n=1 Tax=Micromonospora sp. WMMD1082 TaxID=3016104 RepID=UPI002415D6D0|nr:HAD-IC family P-type ATPase [Micromonospora sp. WMMD1082]MDG4797349.1 HAD-IC family P-type ATPase [Micromonospora sp. WMMD1082]
MNRRSGPGAAPSQRRGRPADRAAGHPDDNPWHALPVDEVERVLTTGDRGLAAAEATRRRQRYGPNRLAEERPTPAVIVLLRQFRSPLIVIMLVAFVIVLLLREYLDSIVVAAALALNAVVGFTQERKAERTVRALAQLVVPHARVVRDGGEREIDSVDLVPGDVVLLESGVRVPADLRLTVANTLRVDESMLTGESEPVGKDTAPVDAEAPVADRRSMAYSGSAVSSGRGTGVVVATGTDTELGAIAGLIRNEGVPTTPLQHAIAGFAKLVGIAVLAVSAVAFVSGLLMGESVRDMFMVAVALAVATVPEGLPVAVTITLAIGVRRMARRNAIVRHLPAVETLGSTTVIGSDKTGTLTENRMTVRAAWAGGRTFRFDRVGLDGQPDPATVAAAGDCEALRLTLLAGVLSNEADVARRDGRLATVGDPTEVAMLTVALGAGLDPTVVRREHRVVAEQPFEPARRYSASVRTEAGRHTLYVKGAPERVAGMCTAMLTAEGTVPFDPDAVAEAARDFAAGGLRVLAFAYRVVDSGDLDVLDREPGELVFCGLQAMADPPRAGVREAIGQCREAGIRVLMITGDHATTAGAIAGQLGITDGPARVLEGTQLRRLSDGELRDVVADTSVFARVSPEQKLRVVTALRDSGQVVAVTGDGVNDAPALRAAQIGVAMGRDGTDVAREAADMVLADDNFTTIVSAVRVGRVTFDNIRKVTFFLVSTAAGLALAILSGLWLGWPLLMVPAQLVWLNIVTSGLQDLALAFEPGAEGVLRRRPRRLREGIMSRLLWERTVISGVVMAAGTLWMFHRELTATGSLMYAQTVALSTMVVFQAFQAGNARSHSRSLLRMSPFSNRFLFLATAGALTLHVVALYLPPTRYMLRVEPLRPGTWAVIVAVALSIVVAVEAHKALRRRWPIAPPR